MITSVIDTNEYRDVATADVACAFLHTQSDEDVTMVLGGAFAKLMVKVDPALYRKFITTTSKGKSLLYVKIHKALYGLLRSALLFYRKLVGDLEAEGFTINPYDPCVANKLINGKQLTILWHVDDLKISHVNRSEVNKMPCILDSLHLDNILLEFPEKLGAIANPPAADHLFQLRPDEETHKLPEPQAVAFHHTTAQLPFLSPRFRRDCQTAVAFLTIHVKAPD